MKVGHEENNLLESECVSKFSFSTKLKSPHIIKEEETKYSDIEIKEIFSDTRSVWSIQVTI